MTRWLLLALPMALLACASMQEAPEGRTGFVGSSSDGWPTDFVAHPSTKMSVDAWYAFLEQVKSVPARR